MIKFTAEQIQKLIKAHPRGVEGLPIAIGHRNADNAAIIIDKEGHKLIFPPKLIGQILGRTQKPSRKDARKDARKDDRKPDDGKVLKGVVVE